MRFQSPFIMCIFKKRLSGAIRQLQQLFSTNLCPKTINSWYFSIKTCRKTQKPLVVSSFLFIFATKNNLEKSFSQELSEKKEKRFSRLLKKKKVQDMKQSRFIVAALSMSCITTLSSCFKEEPLNAECDIEQAYIHADNKISLNLLFTNPSDTLVNVQSDQTNIEFTMRPFAALTKQAPIFRLTPGATISPESGSLQDFSKGPVTYTVTSEDKQWSRTYQVSIKKGQTTMPNEIEFEFENAYLSKGYYNWQENWNGNKLDIWATGNSGFQMSNSSSKPEEYPTVMIEDGHKGKGVKLTTQRTGGFADVVKKPIAAGNLFIGQFNATDALTDAMKATKFGHPFSFDAKPAKLEGWYKYQAGEKFTDKNMKPLDRHDYGTIYAVLYENIDEKGNAVLLYGDNVQTCKQIVALALVGETHDDNGKIAIGNTPEWHHFSVGFEYKKAIDPIKLKNGGYSLTIVSSSSSDGANFLGAVGSTLWIDSFKLICK